MRIDLTPDVGSRIRRLREAKNLTIEELGDKCGISKGSLSEIEHGRDLRASTIVRIAKALGVRPSSLFQG